MRATTFVTARPQPALIRQQHGDTAFALPVQHQQRVLSVAQHHGLALRRVDTDGAEPAAPLRRLVAGAFQPAGDGVFLARFRKTGVKSGLMHLTRRLRRQHGG
ncbi:hypothetical protein D3C78_1444080 [compost metagenome]